MPEHRVTIADVARAAGVSQTAVSFALNGRPGLADATRAHILRVAEEIGWRPNASARSLSTRRALALGLVFNRPPELFGADPFFPSFIGGVETVLAPAGQSLVLHVVRDDAGETRAYRRLAQEGVVDGVFVTDLRRDDPRLPLLEDLGLPAVTLNRPESASPFPAVCLDDRPGITAAVGHLAGLGHRRIAHVGGPGAFLRQLEVTPRMDGQRFVGWQLVQLIDQTGPLHDLDVVPGDVLLAVNGKPLSRPDQLQAVWDSLRTANEIDAELWRGDAKLTLSFAVEPKVP